VHVARAVLTKRCSINVFQSPGVIESRAVEIFPEQSRESWVIVEVKQTLPIVPPAIKTQPQHEEALSEVTGNSKDTEMATPEEDPKQSSEGRTSSESSKKRKRTLIKLKDLEEEQSQMNDDTVAENPELHHAPPRHDHRDISRGKEGANFALQGSSGYQGLACRVFLHKFKCCLPKCACGDFHGQDWGR